MRPFWHHLQVQTHDDGISVAAVDDLNLPATRRTSVPSVPTVPTVPTLPTQRTRDVEVACPSPPRRPDRTGQAADAVAA